MKLLKGPPIRPADKVFQNIEADSSKISWVKTKCLKIISIGPKYESNFPTCARRGSKMVGLRRSFIINFLSKMFQGHRVEDEKMFVVVVTGYFCVSEAEKNGRQLMAARHVKGSGQKDFH